jgi:hypothetical protein
LKGCGELKRGLKNYQQRRAGTLHVVGENKRKRERERERERAKRTGWDEKKRKSEGGGRMQCKV